MKFLNSKPSHFLAAYIALIVTYACLYVLGGNSLGKPEMSVVEAIYFSVVVITTLGFGDVTPKTEPMMLIVSSEAVLGVLIIGMYLGSLWQSFALTIEAQQEEIIRRRLEDQNRHKLRTVHKILRVSIGDFRAAVAELTTPIGNRKGVLEINDKFKFSDFCDLYKDSVLTKAAFKKPVIRYYYEKQDKLIDDIKFLLSSFDLSAYPKLEAHLADYVSLSGSLDARDALLSNENTQAGGKRVSEFLAEQIKTFDECPPIEKYYSNVITPVIMLHDLVRLQIGILNVIDEEFKPILSHKRDGGG